MKTSILLLSVALPLMVVYILHKASIEFIDRLGLEFEIELNKHFKNMIINGKR